jgi:methionyl aminopeptidase
VITRKSPREIAMMREAGRVVAEILQALKALCRPGIETKALDAEAVQILDVHGAVSLFKGYRGYPATICVSVNEEVVHGIPGSRALEEGDIVSLDVGVRLRNYCADAAITCPVGRISEARQRLMRVTEEALWKGIETVKPNSRISDIAGAVQDHVERHGYSVVRKFVGHGIGRELHEAPQVPNYRWDASENYEWVLRPGIAIAIEPMVNEGTHEVDTLDNGWTVVTRDRRTSAHFEHTVAVTPEGHEVLTLP